MLNSGLETFLRPASRLPRPPCRRNRVLVLARDPAVISAAETAVRVDRRGSATVVESGREALAHLAAPGDALPHLVCDPSVVTSHWPQVLANLSDPSGTTQLVLMSASDGDTALPPDGER